MDIAKTPDFGKKLIRSHRQKLSRDFQEPPGVFHFLKDQLMCTQGFQGFEKRSSIGELKPDLDCLFSGPQDLVVMLELEN